MKRVLLIAPYFLPRRRVGSMRPFRFAIHLREFGWEPTVLTIAAEGQTLTEKEARLLKDVEVVSLKPPFDRSVRAESQLGLAPKGEVEAAYPKPKRHRLADQVDRLFPVDTWMLLFWTKHRQIAETVERVQPDVLWSTGDPWSGLVLGRRLARQFGLPWVADFRDPWTLCDVRTDGKPGLIHAIDKRIERRILETADVVLFQAEETEQNYRRHYADLGLETTTIYNSYDPLVFDAPVDLDAATPRAVSSQPTLDLGFFGRFRAMSPASVMVEVLEEAYRRHGALAEQIRIYSFGPLNEEDARYAAAKGVLDNFARREVVPLEQALLVLQHFDMLLLSTDPRRDEIIPAKLLEYLAAGRPILSLSQNPEVKAILQRTGTGIQPDLADKGRIADLLIEGVKAKRERSPLPIPFAPKREAVERFEARHTTKELAALFDAVRHARGRVQTVDQSALIADQA